MCFYCVWCEWKMCKIWSCCAPIMIMIMLMINLIVCWKMFGYLFSLVICTNVFFVNVLGGTVCFLGQEKVGLLSRSAWQGYTKSVCKEHPFLLSPSGDLRIGLVWDNNRTPPHPTTAAFWSDCWNPRQNELNHLWWVLSCSSDDIRWF